MNDTRCEDDPLFYLQMTGYYHFPKKVTGVYSECGNSQKPKEY